MGSFPLKIVTSDGLIYDGQAQMVRVRSTTGELAIMARHINFVCPLGMGEAAVVEADGKRRTAACIGGMLSMVDGEATLIPTTFEWADQIDTQRADASRERAEAILNNQNSSDVELRLAEARLKRALIRKSVAQSVINS